MKNTILIWTFCLFAMLLATPVHAQILRIHDGGPIIGLNEKIPTTQNPDSNVYNMTVGGNEVLLHAGTLYDSGGPSGNYQNNEDLVFIANGFNYYEYTEVEIEYDFENFYDSLVISDEFHFRTEVIKGTGAKKLLFRGDYLRFEFRSNAFVDNPGFCLKWRCMNEKNDAPQVYEDLYELGNKLLWLPWKAAFRAGTDRLGYWSEAEIGVGSAAFGSSTKALGSRSMAWGAWTEATGNYSTAWGASTEATGNYSTAWGNSTEATDSYSTAWGSYTEATGYNSTAWGDNSIASGGRSTAWGVGCTALGFRTTAWGDYSTASGNYTTAWGSRTQANTYLETALGRYNNSSGSPDTWISSQRLFAIGNGTADNDRNNAFVIYKNGNGYLQGTWSHGSDKKLKKDIKPLQNAGELLSKLNGYTYYWKNTQRQGADRQVGVIAQEVQQVLPDLVKDNENNHLSVNYIGFIPYLIEANKELRVESEELKVRSEELEAKNEQQVELIEQLNKRVAKLEALMERLDTDMEHCCEVEPQNKTENELLEEKTETKAYLEQNVPNPSNKSTRINYHLPEGSKAAQLQISTLDGKLVKTYALTQIGQGSVTVKSGQLPAGTYLYSLVIDNIVLDSKQMILVD